MYGGTEINDEQDWARGRCSMLSLFSATIIGRINGKRRCPEAKHKSDAFCSPVISYTICQKCFSRVACNWGRMYFFKFYTDGSLSPHTKRYKSHHDKHRTTRRGRTAHRPLRIALSGMSMEWMRQCYAILRRRTTLSSSSSSSSYSSLSIWCLLLPRWAWPCCYFCCKLALSSAVFAI